MAFVQANHYLSVSTPLGKDKLLLRRLRGEERVSGLFHFFLDMQSEDPALDFSKIVGKSATVTVELADGSKRYVNGIVGRFVQAGGDARFFNYHAELRPWLWLTTLSADCRIWQNKSVVDIVTGLFKELGFTDFRNATSGTYDPLEYCVQYNETYFAFVSRLLEDAGISYFFEHADGKHTLVLADDSSAYKACPGAAKVTVGADSVWQQQNVVTSCVLEENVIPGVYAVDDYSFETPATDLTGTSKSTKATNGSGRRVYEYPGGFTKKNPGDATAKRRMEELEVPNKVLRGASYCRAFFAGAKTTLEKHYRSDANAAYLLLAVEHEATEDGYANSFEAVPADVPLRPQRRTPRPRIAGTQTAAVVGKSGEEIWTDKYGRVKVQFHWDQKGKSDENSSCWIRVDQGWAGKSWGGIFLPRIGQEVVVSFEEGDPDRPLITGAVYNAEQVVPYTLPDEQTKSTVKTNTSKGGAGFNELRFEDKKVSEEVYLHAQKDHNIVVENDRTKTVKNKETNTIKSDRSTTISEGNDTYVVAKGNRTFQVQPGNETYEVKGTRDLTVTGNETHTDKADYTQKVTGNYPLEVTGNYELKVTGNVTINVTGSASVKSTGAMSHETQAAMSNKGLSVATEAQTSLTTKGNASATVESSGVTQIKGSLVQIN